MFIRNFLKVSWMFCWRIAVLELLITRTLTPIIYLALISVAALVVFVFKKTMTSFPLIRLITMTGLWPFVDIYSAAAKSISLKNVPMFENDPQLNRYESVNKSFRNGKNTGYDVNSLRSIPTVAVHAYTENTQLMANLMSKVGLFTHHRSLWSQSVPSAPIDPNFMIATEDAIYPIFVRSDFVSGDVEYAVRYKHLLAFDNASNHQFIVGMPTPLSYGMSATVNYVQKKLPKLPVHGIMVILNNEEGEGTVRAAADHIAGVQLMTTSMFVEFFKNKPPASENSTIAQALYSLDGWKTDWVDELIDKLDDEN